MVDNGFQKWPYALELAIWENKSVVNNFLGNCKHDEYADVVDNMLKASKRFQMFCKCIFAFTSGRFPT